MLTVRGRVLFGINSIYAVLLDDGTEVRCRIKGKVLDEGERSYNPIAPGDEVEIARDPKDPSSGMLVKSLPRRTILARWNQKGRARQVIAANADVAVCLTSPQSPPFRPRFIDRVIAAAEEGGLEALVVVNKADLPMDPGVDERIEDFRRIGYGVILCSALTGKGIPELSAALKGKTAVLVGQSGVGKSSIINAFDPGLRLKVGEVSQKYDRGSHTTNHAALLKTAGGLSVIDTPGIRELMLADILPDELAYRFKEFERPAGSCEVPVCKHDGEPGCAVRAAVEAGDVHPDRYESYLRMLSELREYRRARYG
jgi:ribosome biogenesis GTPase